ncbi:MAG TPA: hypothetical protein VEZ12_03915 [Herpetosiphonaceae bacterium]|nr:hypothetical protein [Herpetosiphonaceae bacterium]
MASDPAAALTAGPLAPTELALLHGERFTTAQVLLGATGDPQVMLLHADVHVSARQLGQALLQIAFLANDQARAIRLEPRPKKKLFGLSSTDALFADPGGQNVSWPAGSLESRIRPLVDRLAADGDNDVQSIIAALVERSAEPWALVSGLVAEGLGSRGLLQQAPMVEPDLFPQSRWTLPEDTRRMAADQKIGPVEQLLGDCERDRPELWQRLNDQIEQAIEQQTDSSR